MKIVLVSDTHLTARPLAYSGNWDVVADWVHAQRPDHVIHLGDITADGVKYPGELNHARSLFDRLGCPVSCVPGNHDIGDNPPAPGVMPKETLDLERLAQYERLFGADRWCHDALGWRLIGLNAQLLGTDTPRESGQFEWLDRQLRDFGGPVGVFLHKPLFRNGPADDEVHPRYVPLDSRRRLLEMLAHNDLRFVASGHAHQTRSIRVDGVEHVWAPSTAFVLPDSTQERIGDKVVGVLNLELDESNHHFELQTLSLVCHSL